LPDEQTDLAQAIQDVTRHAQAIVREEIELAKAEVGEKASKLARGAAVGAAAGIFAVAALIYLLHALAWLLARVLNDQSSVWVGYGITTLLLFILAAVAGLIAYRLVRRGTPPTPKMAIEEAQLVRDTVQSARAAEIERGDA
jgi:uncharacterized membrane protein YqjE